MMTEIFHLTCVHFLYIGNSNTRLNKERQKQYKLELEQQIQEKEMLKAK